MSAILDKSQMSEEDIKLRFITPALTAKWSVDQITMETRITDGRINIRGNIAVREKPKKADYVLYLNAHTPIAIVEAKDNNHTVSFGLQQAITYATMMDIPFAYSSNGDAFYEHDFLTGQERQIALDEFPSPAELQARYYGEIHEGKGLTEKEKAVQQQPYFTSQKTYTPRYYQRNAVNRAVEAIDELYTALTRLEIINITLNEDDNPQLIFESLNSTGLALSEGDKIRNYILMGLPAKLQNQYYEKYWNKREESTGYDCCPTAESFSCFRCGNRRTGYTSDHCDRCGGNRAA